MLGKLKDFTEERYKKYEESYKAWNELKKFISPLITDKEKDLLDKVNSHFTSYPMEDLLFVALMSAPLFMTPKSYCLKCGKEIKNESEN